MEVGSWGERGISVFYEGEESKGLEYSAQELNGKYHYVQRLTYWNRDQIEDTVMEDLGDEVNSEGNRNYGNS